MNWECIEPQPSNMYTCARTQTHTHRPCGEISCKQFRYEKWISTVQYLYFFIKSFWKCGCKGVTQTFHISVFWSAENWKKTDRKKKEFKSTINSFRRTPCVCGYVPTALEREQRRKTRTNMLNGHNPTTKTTRLEWKSDTGKGCREKKIKRKEKIGLYTLQ